MTRHEANSMKETTPKSDEVWYVDSGMSNHMTSYKEGFSYLEKLMQLGVVATGDDTSHPIANVREVPLSHVGQKGKLMNVLHVPTITKNLVSVGQIVYQGMEVRFTHLGCFIEEEGCHDDTHIMTRKDLNPRPCSTHVKSLTIVFILLYV